MRDNLGRFIKGNKPLHIKAGWRKGHTVSKATRDKIRNKLRGVGYEVREVRLDEQTESISATNIRRQSGIKRIARRIRETNDTE